MITVIEHPVMSQAPSSMEKTDWSRRYAELSEMMLRVRRLCPRLPVLGMATLRATHFLSSDQVQLMEELEHLERRQASTRRVRAPALTRLIWRWLRCVVFACRDTFSLGYLQLRFNRDLKRLMRQPARVIMRTWNFSPPPPDESTDFYYGSLPQQVEARGVSYLLLCGDGLSKLDAAFTRAVLNRERLRGVPEHLLVPIWAPIVMSCRQLTAALALRRLAIRAADDRFAAVCRAASLGSLQTITQRNALNFYSARRAVKTWRAKAFVTLYEGQPWEHPAWHGAKAADPDCLTVGFQHTVLLAHNFSLLRSQDNGQRSSQPDVVLCSGPRTKVVMREGHQRSRLVTFGTYRPFPEHGTSHRPSPARRTVLVVPESGFIREAKILFNFAMSAARSVPDHRFIFRCHPMMPFGSLRHHLRWAPEMFPNIELSEASFAEDCGRSSVILYRGSSSVLYAVMYGLKPVYLHDERHQHGDPLFELTLWRERVTSGAELEWTLRRYAATKDGVLDEWRAAADYVRRYAIPVSGAAVDGFLAAVNLATAPSVAGTASRVHAFAGHEAVG